MKAETLVWSDNRIGSWGWVLVTLMGQEYTAVTQIGDAAQTDNHCSPLQMLSLS